MILRELPIDRRSGQSPPPDHQGGRLRLLLMGAGMLLAFMVLGYRLYDLQIAQNAQYVKRGQQNSVEIRTVPALRGLIYDRDGIPLVLNAPAYEVTIVPAELPSYDASPSARVQQRLERTAIYNRLADLLAQAPQYVDRSSALNVAAVVTDTERPSITAGEIYTRVQQAFDRGLSFESVVIAENVPRNLALILEEQSINMPGVSVQTVGSRVYPYRDLVGSILGYISKIPAERAQDYKDRGYDPGTDRVGVAGVEFAVESDVRGRKGEERVLLDASREEKGRVGDPIPPQDGYGVRLSLDLRLQRIISTTMMSVMKQVGSPRGAAVALNPNTGEVLGLWGWPTYDNNLLIRGITQSELDAFQSDLHRPLLNKATSDRVPPGSIFKIITAAALLEEGVVDPNFRVSDPGIFSLPDKFAPDDKKRAQTFYCWLRTGHGFVNISDALRQSCDTYFYKTVGGYPQEGILEERALGPLRLAKWMQLFGIGEPPAIEIGAAPGFVPSPQWKRNTFGEVWTTGDNYNMAIGQGFVLATPLEMANVMASIANGGTLYQPQIVREVVDAQGAIVRPFQPKPIRQLPIKPQNMKLIQDALQAVVGPSGTAPRAAIPGMPYAGKTGTAEFCDDIAQQTGICYIGIKVQPSHAWFVSYAPAKDPQIAMAVYVWDGGQGSGVAAPITQQILSEYFKIPLAEKDRAMIITEKNLGTE